MMFLVKLCQKTAHKKMILGILLGLSSLTLLAHELYYKDSKSVIREIDLSLKNVKAYVRSLTPLQAEDLIRRIGVNNLTSEISRQQFLTCPGISILQNRPARIPPSYQHCKKMSFQSSGPVVALGSFPGSGNSWVRQLLESSTGVYTGAVYCDKSYIEKGMIGEGVITENVIVIKTHAGPDVAKQVIDHDKAIYIVRNPFGAILANYNRHLGKNYSKDVPSSVKESHTFVADPKYAYKKDWNDKVKSNSHKWKNKVMQWLSITEYPVLFIGYENLMKDTYTELKRMLDFIGHPYSEDDISCAIESSDTFHRHHTTENYLNVYSPEQQELVINIIKDVNAGLIKHNIYMLSSYH